MTARTRWAATTTGITAQRSEPNLTGPLDIPALTTATRGALSRQEKSCQLPPEPASVRAAREFAKTTLRAWGLAELVDDMVLIVSELVTNALRYGMCVDTGHPTGEEPTLPDSEPVQLRLVRTGPYAVCLVSDPSADIPRRESADAAAETGRGLQVVAAYSRQWGSAPREGGGKVVWAMLALPGSP